MNYSRKNGMLNLGPNWPVVLVAFYGCCLHSGTLIYAFSLFVNPLQTVFGWDRTTIMMAFTIQLLCLGLVSPFAGRAVDRFGAKKVISFGSVTATLGFLVLPFTQNLIHFYIGCIIAGLGSAGIGPVPCSAAVTEAYDKRRGIAVGIMSTGIGVGGFVAAPVIGGMLLPHFGWKISYICIAAMALTMLPMAQFFLKNKTPDKESDMSCQAQQASGSDAVAVKQELLSTSFFLIAAGFFMFLFSVVGALQSHVPHFQDMGFSLLTASSYLGVSALFSAFAKFIFGLLCDRYHPKAMFVVGASFLISAILLLKQITPESSPVLIWAYAVLLGIGMGSWLPIMSMLVSTSFTLAFYGTIFGAMSLVQQVGTATGPLAAGFIFDKTGSYESAFVLYLAAAIFSVIAIIAAGTKIKNKATLHPTAKSDYCLTTTRQ